MGRYSLRAAGAGLCLWLPTATLAQSAIPEKIKAEMHAAWKAADKAAIRGPATIKLLDEGTLQLPAGEAFVPAAEANRVMASMGNQSSPSRFGFIVATDTKLPWIVDIDWVKEGYVRDGDAKEWQPGALLKSLRDGTEEGNSARLAKGLPALDVVGWVQPPAYDARAHRLVWSMALRDRGSDPAAPHTINYNTYALGRDGYFGLDLLTGSDTIAGEKHIATDLLSALSYNPGKRYEDFNGSTDKVAAYGIAALIGAVAVKKLGLLAVIGVFMLKVWKLGLIAIVAASSAIRRFFKRGAPPAGGA